MENLLDLPPILGKPKLPLEMEGQKLKAAAELYVQQVQRENANFRSGLINRVKGPPPSRSTRLTEFKDAVWGRIKSHHGSDNTPARNAKADLDDWAQKALNAGYPLENEIVRERFMWFLMAVVTQGFEGKENTGTLAERTHDDVRGMGHFDYSTRKY